jgi:hypothetical protein
MATKESRSQPLEPYMEESIFKDVIKLRNLRLGDNPGLSW